MSRLSLEEIGERVRTLFGETPLASHVSDVAVMEDDDQYDESLLRVLVTLNRPRKVNMREMVDVVHRIRRTLIENDDRFLVFQFPEAA